MLYKDSSDREKMPGFGPKPALSTASVAPSLTNFEVRSCTEKKVYEAIQKSLKDPLHMDGVLWFDDTGCSGIPFLHLVR